MVLFTASRGNTFVRRTCALPSALLVSACNSERIIKIGQYLRKLCSNEKKSSFLLTMYNIYILYCFQDQIKWDQIIENRDFFIPPSTQQPLGKYGCEYFRAVFIARQHTDARYWYSNSVCLSVCSSVRHVLIFCGVSGCSGVGGCSCGVVVEYRTRNREVADSIHTRSTASNLEQVANLLCAQAWGQLSLLPSTGREISSRSSIVGYGVKA